MKVSELLEAVQGEPGQGGKFAGGALYRPHYDDNVGHQRGSVLDWMQELDISKDDIKLAISELKASPEFKAMQEKGFRYVAKPESEKRGTICFEVTKSYPPYREGEKRIEHLGYYQIFANGLIRSATASAWNKNAVSTTPLKSPKPVVRAGDKVGSLVRIYKASMKALVDNPRRNNKKV